MVKRLNRQGRPFVRINRPLPAKYSDPAWLLERVERARREAKPNQKHGIYVVQCLEFIKVGICTRSFESRLSGLQVGNPFQIEPLHLMPGSLFLEKRIHFYLSADKQLGEWFRMGGERSRLFLDALERGAKALESKIPIFEGRRVENSERLGSPRLSFTNVMARRSSGNLREG